MWRLIINADDLGFTSGVNRAIVKAHRDGVVTSATLMANGQAFCEAKALSKGASEAEYWLSRGVDRGEAGPATGESSFTDAIRAFPRRPENIRRSGAYGTV